MNLESWYSPYIGYQQPAIHLRKVKGFTHLFKSLMQKNLPGLGREGTGLGS